MVKPNWKDWFVVGVVLFLLLGAAYIAAVNLHNPAIIGIVVPSAFGLGAVLHWFYIKDDKTPDA